MKPVQLSFLDCMPEAAKQSRPELRECMKTCTHCGEYMIRRAGGDGNEYCAYGRQMDGTSGNDVFRVTDVAGTVHFYCKYYKNRGGGNNWT